MINVRKYSNVNSRKQGWGKKMGMKFVPVGGIASFSLIITSAITSWDTVQRTRSPGTTYHPRAMRVTALFVCGQILLRISHRIPAHCQEE